MALLTQAACVMVPVDSRTGLPVTWPQAQPGTQGQSAAVAPPVSPGPPSPVVYTARLYPLNDAANRAGMLTAVVTDGNGGRGTFSLSYLGDAMQGEASRVEPSYPGFGRVMRDVLGTAPDSQLRGPRGIANASGSRGVSAQCEYVLNAPGRGTGACVFSDGARYQLHFG
ncbi:MAG TPA: hypothetical protein VML58_04880 [Burkholderiaceae bacterium]|nr:hypothetical protein [Burkholderiaceae bacterium]